MKKISTQKSIIKLILITAALFILSFKYAICENIKYSFINKSNNNSVEMELSKLPNSLIKDIENVGVSISVDKNYLENRNFKYNGEYNWNTKKIVIDDKEIEKSLVHEVGHALDNIWAINEDEQIKESFNNREFEFGCDNYYNSDIREYVAQGIYYYYDGSLEKDSLLYGSLNEILSYYK